MSALVRYFITHPVWANVLMFSVFLFGYFSAVSMKSSFFPESESNVIQVEMTYPGTSPEEIEKSLVLKVEENLRGLAGIEMITSVSSENSARLVITSFEHYDMQELLSDVKNAVDRISPYPVDAERPVVYIQKAHQGAISVALHGEADLWALKEYAEKFRDDLISVEGISQVSIQGLPQREIALLVREADLRRYQLGLGDIASAVRRYNVDISGGKLDLPDEEVLIRFNSQRLFSHELLGIVVKSLPNGTLVRLSDVARVKEDWSDSPRRTYYNGARAIVLEVDQTLEEDILFIAKKVREKLEVFQKKYPELHTVVLSDRTVHLKGRINMLKKNGWIGFLLVVVSLGLFLNWRVALWVALGIPFSFAGMFIVGKMAGITINVISLFGMIIVVGMLVDDAIVVAENIFQNVEKGISPFRAAYLGTLEVMAPVFTAVMTTVLAFMPFFFFEGRLGKMIWQVALVVIAALMFSLVESMLILPMHLSHSRGLRRDIKPSSLRGRLEAFYTRFTRRVFGPVLRRALGYKWITISVAYGLLLLSMGVVSAGWVGCSQFPHIPRDEFKVDLSLTSGTQEHITDSLLAEIETRVWELNEILKNERNDGRDVIVSVERNIGSNDLRDQGSHAGQLSVEVLPGDEREITTHEIVNRLRKKVGVMPGVQKLTFGGGGRWGKPVTLSLLGEGYAGLKRASAFLQDKLKEFNTLKDVIDNDVEGRREIRLELLPLAKAVGLSPRDIATQIRQGFFGQEIQRLQRGNDEIRIWVRYAAEDRMSLGHLENMRIRAGGGAEYPLSQLARHTIERGIVNIVHLDGKREVRVEADVEDPDSPIDAIVADVKRKVEPQVRAEFPDVTLAYEGRERDNAKFLRSIKRAFPLALFGIYVILALVFRSYLQALLIFAVIPLGFIGALLGHWVHGLLLSRLSLFGLIALTGIVINDSIVYIDQINRNLREGMKVVPAVVGAGLTRFRPILLTTVTTVLGLGPIILETSRQAQFLIPMAVSIAYGLFFGSLMILFVVPSWFLVLNSLRYYFVKYVLSLYVPVDKSVVTRESVEPATSAILQDGDL